MVLFCSEPAQDVFRALISEGACLIVLADDFETVSEILSTPEMIPILVDVSESGFSDRKGIDKIIRALPSMDHIVNLRGDSLLDLFGRLFRHFA